MPAKKTAKKTARKTTRKRTPARKPQRTKAISKRLPFRIAKAGACELIVEPRNEGGTYYSCENKSCDGRCKLYIRPVGGGMFEVGCECQVLV